MRKIRRTQKSEVGKNPFKITNKFWLSIDKMTTKSGRSHCVKCGKERATSKCGGCQKDFCWNDLVEHRQELSNELDGIQTERNLFRQALTETMSKVETHSVIDQINQWEKESIRIVKKAAESARATALTHLTSSMEKLEKELNTLSDQIRQNQEDNDFFETDLHRWKEVLDKLKHQLKEPKNITIRHKSNSNLIKELIVDTSGHSTSQKKRQENNHCFCI